MEFNVIYTGKILVVEKIKDTIGTVLLKLFIKLLSLSLPTRRFHRSTNQRMKAINIFYKFRSKILYWRVNIIHYI